MLELKNIVKEYPAGTETIKALKGISLTFRKHEFVSILGPSGCGKTTLLNIAGGLDKYTSGDLIINGVSTKEYKDRDWDAYRNHSVGFVFQSYNLIPHQTVLQNVELALTLSGVSKAERKRRAKAALTKVGLANQMKKRPAEMSGGQMQRVAIARAIVNNPDIILADEPTGALDTETSIQVMDILKKISKDCLVIMVTHNPDLAKKYSSRIIKMLDGEIKGDSNPLSKTEKEKELKSAKRKVSNQKNTKRPSMKFSTSFGLSLKNLFTKKKRTALTIFAGSIGIIGIALIYAVSQGTTNYIDFVQEETLSSYPLTIESHTIDMSSLMETFVGKAKSAADHDNDAVYQKNLFFIVMNSLNSADTTENDLVSFKEFLDKETADEESSLYEAISGIHYTYNTDFLVYTRNVDGNIIHSDINDLFGNMFGTGTQSTTMTSSLTSSSMESYSALWQEMLPGDNGKLYSSILEKQYDVVYGHWPTQYNEVVLIMDANNEVNDMALYALGLSSQTELRDAMTAIYNHENVDYENKSWTYEEICNMDFRVIPGYDCYVLNEDGTYSDLRETETGLEYLFSKGINLKISGIIKPNEDAITGMLTGAIAYTHDLTKYIIEQSEKSSTVQAQKDNPYTDIFTGLLFESTSDIQDVSEKANLFRTYVNSLDASGKAKVYIRIKSIPNDDTIQKTADMMLARMSAEDLSKMVLQGLSSQANTNSEAMESYISQMSEEELKVMVRPYFVQQMAEQSAARVAAELEKQSDEELSQAMILTLASFTAEQCAEYYDSAVEFSPSSLSENLRKLGCVDLNNPSTINIYASTFENKDIIEQAIKNYNSMVDDLSQIKYTDYVGIIMSSVKTIINAITYVLIAFVSVSLVVSSIMIGVITLISVQERTKEIGILRAIGASKKNVSGMFNAETVIIGFASGLLGVSVTWLLCIPINIILKNLTSLNNLQATLPLEVAVLLVAISVLLTLISGIIPSRSAAKKDPVVALRSE